MSRKKHIVLIGVVGLLLTLSFPIEAVSLTLDWSDDFADGNYDGWTVTQGTYDATSGKLTVTGLAPGPELGIIDHPSNSSFGNWTFDVEIVNDPEENDFVWITFLRVERGIFETGIGGGTTYSIEWQYNYWSLIRGGSESGDLLGDRYYAPMSWEHHIRIERCRDNETYFHVYHNNTLAITGFALVVERDYGLFSFHATVGSSIDNIIVEHEPEPETTPTDTEPTDTTPTPTPTDGEPLDMTLVLMIAGGGVAVIVVIAIIVRMRS